LILLLTNSFDEHADAVEPMLKSIDCEWRRLNMDVWQEGAVSFMPAGGPNFHVKESGKLKSFTSKEITAVWYRRPNSVIPPVEPQTTSDKFASGEWKHIQESLYVALNDCFWINDLDSLRMASSKFYQLQCARKHGFATPKTVITNSPEEVETFVKTFDGPIAYKPLHSFATPSGDRSALLTVFTNIVSREMLKQCAPQIRRAPCIFQEYVAKKLELRITVVGKHVHCAAIDSQASERSSIDWRRYDLANTPYEAYRLPPEFIESIVQFVQGLGLVFCTFDFIVTPDDNFVFLEINPNGQWLWVERLTGLPIAESLVRLLAENDRVPTSGRDREQVLI
jgi:glutathione synthase/RimK-type ligase-like ATP-grasp enzyme